jgi:glycosyltransferase involved in cell wall biosynthesis
VDNEYDHFWATVDEKTYADAVIRLVNRPSLRRELGKAGMHHVRKTFVWDDSAVKMAAVLEDMVAARAVAA